MTATPSPLPLTYSPAVDRTVRVIALLAVTLITCTEYLTGYAVGVALPDIQGDLAASPDEGSWILTTYSTCFLVGLVTSNWLADRVGYRRYLPAAAVLFMLSAAGCGTSHTLAEMLVYRAAMGFAGGTFLARAQTAIYRLFDGKARVKALMVLAVAVVAVARTIGPAVGGYLTEWYSWRTIFFLNVPLILAAVAVMVACLPDVRMAGAGRMRFDGVGLALGVGWIASLQVMLSRGERDDWFGDPLIVTLAVTAAACLPAFVWWERRIAAGGRPPLVPLAVYRSGNFRVGSVYAVLFGMMLYGQQYVVPQLLRGVMHHSAASTGELQTFNAALFFVGLLLGAVLMGKVGVRTSLAVGAGLFAAGMTAWVYTISPQTSDPILLIPLGLTGLGAGWQIGPASTLINRDTPPQWVGVGLEVYLAQRQLGGAWGTAALAILLDRRRSFWSGRMGEHLTAYSLPARDAVRQTAAALGYAGLPRGSAGAAAVGVVHGRLVLQSIVNAFEDTFAYQAALGVAVLALVVLFRPGERVRAAVRWAVVLGR